MAAHPVEVVDAIALVAAVAVDAAVAAAPLEVAVVLGPKPGGGAGLLQQMFGGHGLQGWFPPARDPGVGPAL